MHLRGSNGVKARIFTVYQPVIVKYADHPPSVYQQYKRYFMEQKEDECPNVLLRRDLKKSIMKCRNKHERIAALVDCNEDIKRGKFDRMLKECDLLSPIRQKLVIRNLRIRTTEERIP